MHNSLPYNKVLGKSKLKALSDDKLKVAHLAEFVLDRVENNVGKEKNVDYHVDSFPGSFKPRIVQCRVNLMIVWYFTPFSTVFQLYHGSQCTWKSFLGVLLTSTPYFSKPLGPFQRILCLNNGQQ